MNNLTDVNSVVTLDTVEAYYLEELKNSFRKQSSEKYRMTIVDEDGNQSNVLKELLQQWPIETTSISNPSSCEEFFQKAPNTDIFLIDCQTPKLLQWCCETKKNFPDCKMSVLLDFENLECCIQDIRDHNIDIIIKPIKSDVFQYVFRQLMQQIECEHERIILRKNMEQSSDLLKNLFQEYRFVNKRLLDTNRAFSTLAQNLDFERKEIARKISMNIVNEILPRVKTILLDSKHNLEIEAVYEMLHDLSIGMAFQNNPLYLLTPTELRIISLIEQNFKNSEIAEKLFISVDTVKTHRKHIRKKLNLSNSKIRLKGILSNNTGSSGDS